jgi:hypothetical protein
VAVVAQHGGDLAHRVVRVAHIALGKIRANLLQQVGKAQAFTVKLALQGPYAAPQTLGHADAGGIARRQHEVDGLAHLLADGGLTALLRGVHHGLGIAHQNRVGQGVGSIQVLGAKHNAVEVRIKLHAATKHLLVQAGVAGRGVAEADPQRAPLLMQQQVAGAKQHADCQLHGLRNASGRVNSSRSTTTPLASSI